MSDKLPLPIELYYSNKFMVFSLAFGGAMFWLGYTTNKTANEWLILAISIFLMVFGILVMALYLIFLLNPKPILTITRYRINSGHGLFKELFNNNNTIAFKDIHSLELDYHTHQDVKYWHITFILNTGKKHILPIKNMRYENIMINEKEIFHLINQVHQGQIPPTFVEHDMDIHDRMTKSGLLTIGIIVVILIVGYFLN